MDEPARHQVPDTRRIRRARPGRPDDLPMRTLRNLAAALTIAGLLSAAAPANAAMTPALSTDGMPGGGQAGHPRQGKHRSEHCDHALDGRLDAAVRHTLQIADIPGVIVGFWQPGHCDYERAFGDADPKTDADMRTTLRMRIGSETKTFTATAVLELVDDHRVGLDDPISEYVSGVPDGDHITLRQLAGMRSGLFPYTSDPGFIKALQADPFKPYTPEQLLAFGFKHPNVFPPGTATQYSNTNYILLGLVVEKVSHMSLADFLRARVIEPSCLRHTLFPRGSEFPKPHAHGFTNQTPTGQIVDATGWNTSSAWAAGAMISDLRDLRAWARDVATGSLLTPETQAERTEFLPTPLPSLRYGLGLFDVNGWIGHDGSIPGYQSLTIYLPEHRATLVVLVNTDVPYQGTAPSTLFGKAITSIVSPHHIYDIPAMP